MRSVPPRTGEKKQFTQRPRKGRQAAASLFGPYVFVGSTSAQVRRNAQRSHPCAFEKLLIGPRWRQEPVDFAVSPLFNNSTILFIFFKGSIMRRQEAVQWLFVNHNVLNWRQSFEVGDSGHWRHYLRSTRQVMRSSPRPAARCPRDSLFGLFGGGSLASLSVSLEHDYQAFPKAA